MKMKEICARSGLTERAVRLYCERGLVHPDKHWDRGREYLVFSDHNLRELQVVSELRRAEFTLDEIALMLERPEKCGDVLAGWRGRVTEQNMRLGNAKQKLEEVSTHDVLSAEALAELLGAKITSHGAAPYQGETFAEFCERGPVDDPELSHEMQQISVRQDRQERFGRTFLIMYSIVMGFLTLLSMGLSYASTTTILPGLINIALFVVLTVFLFRGALWSRIVSIIRHVLSLALTVSAMPNYFPGEKLYAEAVTAADGTVTTVIHYVSTEMGILITGLLVLAVLLDLFCVYMLWFHPGVKDYLYEKSFG